MNVNINKISSNFSSNCTINTTGNSNNVTSNSKQIKIGQYLLGTTIGKGNSAVVKLATHCLTRQKVAIKMFDKSGLDADKQLRLKREIDSMKRLRHENVIRLFEIMETTKLICLVTEYASNGELYDYIIHKKRLSEREAKHIFKQIAVALNYCHENHIVHRDVKVENLLLDSHWQVKLADFGFSSLFCPNELLDVFCGSPPYCAPELYLAKLYDGPKVDIWSLGVVLYVLVCGYLPFEAHNFNLLRSQIINGSYKIPFFLSQDCISLIKGMLTIDPAQRFGMSEILNHQWLKSEYDLQQLLTNKNPSPMTMRMSASPNMMALNDALSSNKLDEFEPNKDVLVEIEKYNLNVEDVLRSVRNNEFDSNSGAYYLIESKLSTNRSIWNSHNCNLNQNTGELKSRNTQNATSQNQSKRIRSNKFLLGHGEHNKVEESAREHDVVYQRVSSSAAHNWNIANRETAELNGLNLFELNLKNSSSKFGLVNSNEQTATLLVHPPEIIEEKAHEEDVNEEEDEEMPIDDLGRDYLSRYNAIRRHTIATNLDDNVMDQRDKDILKSTECLLQLNAFNQSLFNNSNFTSDLSTNSSNFNSSFVVHHASSGASCGDESRGTSNIAANNCANEQLSSCQSISNRETIVKFNDSACEQHAPKGAQLAQDFPLGSSSTLSFTSNLVDNQSTNIPLLFNSPNINNSNSSNINYATNSTSSRRNLNHFLNNQYHKTNRSSNSARTRYNQNVPQQPHFLSAGDQLVNAHNTSGRRASDGGSNISLFNQYYTLKNLYNNNNTGGTTNALMNNVQNKHVISRTVLNSDESLSELKSSLRNGNLSGSNSNDDSLQAQFQLAMQTNDSSQCGTNELSIEMSGQMLPSQFPPNMFKSRGSITSGIPIFSNSNTNMSAQISMASQSSEDEESQVVTSTSQMNLNNSYTSQQQSSMKSQRRTSRSRHEPYDIAPTGGVTCGLLNPNQTSPPYRSSTRREREQSFGGSSYHQQQQSGMDFSIHRTSEPNPLDLIYANRSHLERIYNQSINKKNNKMSSINKELQLLQQENLSSEDLSIPSNVCSMPPKSSHLSLVSNVSQQSDCSCVLEDVDSAHQAKDSLIQNYFQSHLANSTKPNTFIKHHSSSSSGSSASGHNGSFSEQPQSQTLDPHTQTNPCLISCLNNQLNLNSDSSQQPTTNQPNNLQNIFLTNIPFNLNLLNSITSFALNNNKSNNNNNNNNNTITNSSNSNNICLPNDLNATMNREDFDININSSSTGSGSLVEGTSALNQQQQQQGSPSSSLQIIREEQNNELQMSGPVIQEPFNSLLLPKSAWSASSSKNNRSTSKSPRNVIECQTPLV